MVVTTQTGKTFLANMNTSCCFQVDPKIEPVYKNTWKGGPHTMSIDWIRKYSERIDGAQQVVSCGNYEAARYDTPKRAKEVIADFKAARDSGNLEFIFPAK